MIKQKLKICSVCEKPSYLWKSSPPMCKGCDYKASGKTGISAKPKALTEAKKSFKQELNVFFASQILQIPERCENCNEKLNAYSSFAKRSVTAHILGKGQNDFPMVATHPLNRMFLGCGLFSDCSCHSLWDLSDAETRKQMKCYPIALERLEAFKRLIPARKQAKAEKYLGL